VGFTPNPTAGTASARTATGGKVCPILAMLLESGRNSAPASRVTKTPASSARIAQQREDRGDKARGCDEGQMIEGEIEQTALIVDRRRAVLGQRFEHRLEELGLQDKRKQKRERRDPRDESRPIHGARRA
jgi:hypothetical protein